MLARRCAAVVGLILGLTAAASADHHEKQTALMKEVTQIGDDLARAMVEKDVDRMLAMYAPGAISLPNYSPRMEGLDAFRESHAQMEAAGMTVLAFDSEPTDVWQAGDQVIEIGKFEITLEMAGMPGEIEDAGKYLTIYERDADGALKIKVETWNTDVNPMMMGGGMMGGPEGAPAAPPAADDQPEDADKVP
jgi:ketosteroid isomerase-like protein